MTGIEPTVEERAAQPYLGITRHVTMDTMVPALPDAGSELAAWLGEHGRTAAGPPFWRYRVIDMSRALEVEVGFPVAAPVATAPDSPVQAGELPAGRYVSVTHVGHPDELEQATGELLDWASAHGLRWDVARHDDGEHWASRLEVYLSDPETEPDMARWRTQLAFKLAD